MSDYYNLLSRLRGPWRYLVVTQQLRGTPAGAIALKAWYAEKAIALRLERPLPEVVERRFREYVKWRLQETINVLTHNPEPLAEMLEEVLLLLSGEEMIIGWAPLSIEEAHARIGKGFRP